MREIDLSKYKIRTDLIADIISNENLSNIYEENDVINGCSIKRIRLDKDKKYLAAFLDKTRNDEDKQTILYEWNGRFNKWTEIGYCTIYNDHAA